MIFFFWVNEESRVTQRARMSSFIDHVTCVRWPEKSIPSPPFHPSHPPLPPPRKKGNQKRKKVKRNRKMTGFPLAKFSQVCPFTRVQAKWNWLVLLANMFHSSKNHSESRSNKIHFPDIFTSLYIVISIKVYFYRNRIVLLSVCKIHKMWSMG